MDDLTKRFLEVKHVLANWIYREKEGYVYTASGRSIKRDKAGRRLELTLKEKNERDEDFKASITSSPAGFQLEVQYSGMEGQSFPLQLLSAEKPIVLYFENEVNRAYFHLD